MCTDKSVLELRVERSIHVRSVCSDGLRKRKSRRADLVDELQAAACDERVVFQPVHGQQ